MSKQLFLLQARSLLSNGHGPNIGNPAYTGFSIAICKNIVILIFNISVIFVALIRIIIIKKIFVININLQWAMVMGRQKATPSQIGTLSLFPSMRLIIKICHHHEHLCHPDQHCRHNHSLCCHCHNHHLTIVSIIFLTCGPPWAPSPSS